MKRADADKGYSHGPCRYSRIKQKRPTLRLRARPRRRRGRRPLNRWLGALPDFPADETHRSLQEPLAQRHWLKLPARGYCHGQNPDLDTAHSETRLQPGTENKGPIPAPSLTTVTCFREPLPPLPALPAHAAKQGVLAAQENQHSRQRVLTDPESSKSSADH